ncbi:hypothetical protein VTK26DRAFT_4937 [Humicola hyalothermophila]
MRHSQRERYPRTGLVRDGAEARSRTVGRGISHDNRTAIERGAKTSLSDGRSICHTEQYSQPLQRRNHGILPFFPFPACLFTSGSEAELFWKLWTKKVMVGLEDRIYTGEHNSDWECTQRTALLGHDRRGREGGKAWLFLLACLLFPLVVLLFHLLCMLL